MKTYDVKNGVIVSEKKNAVKNDSNNWTRFDRRPRRVIIDGKEAILL